MYLPKINVSLCVATIAVVLIFKLFAILEVAYGIAITVTMVIIYILAFYAMRWIWKWFVVKARVISILFLAVDSSFLAANALKVFE